MRKIEVSEEVWEAIAARGKFGEKEDDVLRRVFELSANSSSQTHHGRWSNQESIVSEQRATYATKRQSSYIEDNHLHVSFQGGPSHSWSLPARSDKNKLRSVREEAVSFSREQGATIGQINAVKKTLTDAGYHLTR